MGYVGLRVVGAWGVGILVEQLVGETFFIVCEASVVGKMLPSCVICCWWK